MPHPQHGTVQLMRSPLRMSASEIAIEAAPQLGQHTDQVFADELGLAGEELSELHTHGVIG